MTHHQYALYARIFDDISALGEAGEPPQIISLMGNASGAALRMWAAKHRVDVVPETLEHEGIGSWTVLRASMGGGWSISAHLDDEQPVVQKAEPKEVLF